MSTSKSIIADFPEKNREEIAILLVDDDAKNLLALESILQAPEHRLVKAQTADEALMALMQEDYAAIVLDVQMPDLSGIELARLIKQRKKTQHIPILFLTAHYMENEHAVLGYDVGAVDYLTKPVHPGVLRSKVSVFVDLFRKTRALAEMNRNMESEIVVRKTAEERVRVVVEAAPSAMLVSSQHGELVLVNSQAEWLFGFKRELLLKKNLAVLLSPLILPSVSDLESGASNPAPHETVVRRDDGSEVPVEVSFTPIQSTEGTRLLASVVDITERKRAEAALRTANAELEAKNLALETQAAERSLRLHAEEARAEAEAANAAKDRFLAMLSHELRTPLSPVLHAITLLDETPDVAPEIRETLQLIRRNVHLEARLIDDLLDLARIRNGKLQLSFQPVDAHEVLQHALEICQHGVTTHGLKVDLRLRAGHTIVRADSARLQQIFWNLISNAVKFTPEGGLITITTGNDADEGQLRVEFSDTGAGIDSTRLTRIFDAFEQGPQQTSSGLGLGLAICKALTEFHGGTIKVQSTGAGRGSTFVLTLPTADLIVASPNREKPVSAPLAPVPLRLLVVEDHFDTAAALRRLLVQRGYHVESADSVTSALEVAKTGPIDVLVTDIGLPDGNGVELFKNLRENPELADLQGVALSGFGMDEDIAKSKAAGFKDHLTKPVDFAILQRCLVEIGQELHGNS